MEKKPNFEALLKGTKGPENCFDSMYGAQGPY